MSANDTIHSLFLLCKPTIQHVAAQTSSTPGFFCRGTFQLELFCYGVCKYVCKWHHSQLISAAQTYNSACCSTNFFDAKAFRRPPKETWKAWVQICQAKGVSTTSIRKCFAPKIFFRSKQGALLIKTSTATIFYRGQVGEEPEQVETGN